MAGFVPSRRGKSGGRRFGSWLRLGLGLRSTSLAAIHIQNGSILLSDPALVFDKPLERTMLVYFARLNLDRMVLATHGTVKFYMHGHSGG